MNLLSQSALLAAVISGTLAVLHATRWRKGPLHLPFALLCATLLGWFTSLFAREAFQAGPAWLQAEAVFGLLAPWLTLLFFRAFLGVTAGKGATRIAGLVGVGLVALALLPPGTHPWALTGYCIYAFLVLYGCAFVVWKRLGEVESRIQATRFKYLLVGLLVTVTLSLSDILTGLGFGNAFCGAYLYFLSQAVLRHRLLDLKELLGKGLVLSLLAIVLATIYTLLVVWVGDRPGLMVFNSLVASIVILVLFEPLRSLAERRVAPLLFREKFEFVRRLDALRRDLAGYVEVEAMARHLVGRLERSRRVTHASVYLLAEDGRIYQRVAHVGPSPPAEVDIKSLQAVLPRLAKERLLVVEELEQRLKVAHQRGDLAERSEIALIDAKLEELRLLHAGVLIPLPGKDPPIGLLCLADDRLREAYSYDEIGRMVDVARQAAITVRNSKLYDRLRQRDRFAVIGEMSAGLAHEVRNPLGAIKGAAQVLQSSMAEGDPDPELLGVIVEEVDRLDTVVSRFLDYARPMTVEPVAIDVATILRRIETTLSASPAAEGIEIGVEASDDLPLVVADPEMLQTVLFNLGLNALEAMPEGGELKLSARPAGGSGAPGEGAVEIRVSDTGSGIGPEALESLFIPFYTTKPRGTGLGLAICQRIVHSLGGHIEVSSRPAEGSTFSVVLATATALAELSEGEPSEGEAGAGAEVVDLATARARRGR